MGVYGRSSESVKMGTARLQTVKASDTADSGYEIDWGISAKSFAHSATET